MKKISFLIAVIILFMAMSIVVACNDSNDLNTPVVTEESAVEEPEVTEEVVEEATPEVTEEVKEEVEVVVEEEPEVTEEVVEEATPEVTEEVKEAEPVAVETTAEEPKQKPVAQSISAKVNGNHAVGETLSAADFTITVNMSDGSNIKNPAGWSADKLTLDSENTVINVSYNGMTTSVTVKATATQQPAAPAVQETPAQPQQPAAPAGGRPASANGALTPAAINDIIPYAQARGWSYRVDTAQGGSSIHVLEKSGHNCGMISKNYSMVVFDLAQGYPEPSMSMIYDFIESY